MRGPKSAHFLIGKVPGNAVQLIDTGVVAYHVGPGANALFVGIGEKDEKKISDQALLALRAKGWSTRTR